MSIRLRLAAAFAVTAAILFAIGSWIFITQISSSLLGSIDAQLAAQRTGASRYLSPGGRNASAAGSRLPGEYVVQVIDAADRVRGASADAGLTPMLSAAQLSLARARQITLITTDEGERERVSAAPLPGHPRWVAAAGVSLEAFDGTVSDLSRSLVVAGLVLVAVAGTGAYALARAALSPVERMRREVAALSDRDQAPGVRIPRTRDEIAALAATMNELLSRLHGALARQRALVADASHELRTPLAVLRGELELASRPGRSRAELAEAVARAGEETARLERITEQLLVLARSDENRLGLRLEPTSVRLLLMRSAEHATARAHEAGLSCAVDAPADLTANLDPDRIREAVDNLVDNALRLSPLGSAIQIAGRAEGSDLIIEVRDAGPGFPADFLPHAFERFRRPDSGRARTDGGAGLGLAIVNAITQAHGGQATARNLPQGGAAVALELPGAVGGRSSRSAGPPR